MDSEFYSITIQEPTTLLGLRLRPLSLGHMVLLGRVRSAFVTEGETVTLHDLALSVLICSLTYEDGCQLFNTPNLSEFFRKWHDRITGNGWLQKIGVRKPNRIDWPSKVAAFAKYIEDGSRSPYYSYKPQESRGVNCPTVQIVKVSMMRDLNINERELMDRPWAVCLWDYVTVRALEGHVTFEDRDSIREAQQVADSMAAKINSRECKT